MKLNPDGKTVAAVDLEVPGSGELMGGSQREEDYNKIIKRCDEMGVDKNSIDWFLNLRKFGSCIHSGFGMGFERLIMYLTSIKNKLITHMNYSGLSKELVQEIQSALINKTKVQDFEALLQKVEREVGGKNSD